MPSLLILALLAAAPEHYGRFPDRYCAPEARVLDLKRAHPDAQWRDYARIFLHYCLEPRACVRFDWERSRRELLERDGSFQEAWRQVNERCGEESWLAGCERQGTDCSPEAHGAEEAQSCPLRGGKC